MKPQLGQDVGQIDHVQRVKLTTSKSSWTTTQAHRTSDAMSPGFQRLADQSCRTCPPLQTLLPPGENRRNLYASVLTLSPAYCFQFCNCSPIRHDKNPDVSRLNTKTISSQFRGYMWIISKKM